MSIEPHDAPCTAAADHTLARGMAWVGAFAIAASIARVAQDAAIAWRHGVSPMSDAYYFVANLVNWPVAVALSVMTLMVVPIEAGMRGEMQRGQLRRFRAELLALLLVLAAVALPLTLCVLNIVAGGPLGGLQAATREIALAGIPAIAAAVPLGLIGSVLAAWLVAGGRHVLALFEGIPPMVLALVVWIVPGPAMFWGTTAGMALQVCAMGLTLWWAKGLVLPRLGLRAEAWKGFAAGALLLAVAQVLSTLQPLVDIFFAARMGEGALAALSMANRLVLGVLALAGLALQRVGLPLFADLAARSPIVARGALIRWGLAMAVCGAAATLAGAVLADPLVDLVLERGRFTAVDRAEVAMLMRWGMLQAVPFLVGLVAATALASIHGRGTLAVAAGIGLGVKIVASAALAPPWGLIGLQVATAFMYTATAIAAWVALQRRLTESESAGD